ncbi:hypothetical protein BKA67DRAFT_538855 [Truncatella angustata]|uniref:SnoaL-like domain-containing protein n=1 Tax=Truncatella angustata TaxID=152316 RepID=A0A9P8UFA9_9PEZI|nr:uncharacterized protein BKA67DRAFT_538855 [Truncatella angustata]KAH6648844.1 hypothetical protein BKA67DRAFT_538855 [Truncatella angustata]
MTSHTVQKDHAEKTKDRPSVLRSRAYAFCQALVTPPPPPELLKEFFIPEAVGKNPTIREHGPSWATVNLPFLGRDFVGSDASNEYFKLLSQSLRMQLDRDSFPGEDGFVVDAEANRVAVVGRGRFESVATGRSWDEKFSYVLSGWDEDGRIGRWDIWADPLSAWAAVSDQQIDGWKKDSFPRYN